MKVSEIGQLSSDNTRLSGEVNNLEKKIEYYKQRINELEEEKLKLKNDQESLERELHASNYKTLVYKGNHSHYFIKNIIVNM